ncbi:MAG: 3-deoxy-manno-octulosonate cytidylyltransferase [Beijerinckiaceae bacterium]
MTEPIILIPARMGASRLPGKPLALIAGEAMIVHVWRRAREAAIGPVLVAVDHPEIAEAVEKAGGTALLTRPDHVCGSDRICEALARHDPDRRYDLVINLQGDMPLIDPALVRKVAEALEDPGVDIATLAAPIRDLEEAADPNVVKVVGTPLASGRLRALYFTRALAPWGEGPLYHHIGIYAYRRAALERFVRLPPSALERRERLEQLRALEASMRIDVALVAEGEFGVDSPEDLERARRLCGSRPRCDTTEMLETGAPLPAKNR